RCFFAIIFLFFVLKHIKSDFKFNCRRDFFLAIFTGLMIGISWYFFFQSIKVSSVSVGLLTYATVAIFTTFIEPLYFKTRIHFLDIVLALITIYGVSLVVPKFSLSSDITLGVIFGLIAALSAAVFTIMSRSLMTKYSSIKIAFWQYLTVTILGIPFFVSDSPHISIRNLILIIILGVLFTAFANTLFISSLKRISATKANIILTLEPIYGIILGIIILNERPGINLIIGGVIILLCAFIATGTHMRSKKIDKLRIKKV
ncbi:MAG TPA: DMT family transporter, partial [Victivallales bacterium]|nr:DMT family transporter [Victivallales bacterium]